MEVLIFVWEYKPRHHLVGEIISSELCKKLKFDHTNKWYMHNLDSVQENETHKILWDFIIQTDHLILSRRPDLVIIKKRKKKRTCRIGDFVVPVDHRKKNERKRKKKKKDLDRARELGKLWNMKVIPIVIGALGTVTKGFTLGLED